MLKFYHNLTEISSAARGCLLANLRRRRGIDLFFAFLSRKVNGIRDWMHDQTRRVESRTILYRYTNERFPYAGPVWISYAWKWCQIRLQFFSFPFFPMFVLRINSGHRSSKQLKGFSWRQPRTDHWSLPRAAGCAAQLPAFSFLDETRSRYMLANFGNIWRVFGCTGTEFC